MLKFYNAASRNNSWEYSVILFCVALALVTASSSVPASEQRTTACYPNLGCFDTETGPLSHVGVLPWTPEEINTQVYLFTPSNRYYGETIHWLDPGPLLQSTFDPTLKTVIFSHGFGSAGNLTFVRAIKEAFFTVEPVNFISMDWNKGAQNPNYPAAAANSELVGRQEANLIAMILDYTGLDGNLLHVTGYSLGAQVPNFAANFLKVLKPDFRIPRITGFDPAGPYFYDAEYSAETHLDPSDAEFVDVIHTNGGFLITGHLSSLAQMGHVDFYVNGGSEQPGCTNLIIWNIEDLFEDVDIETDCNHKRSWQLFIESILVPDQECSFISFPCPDLDSFEEDFVDGHCFSCDVDGVNQCGKLGFYSRENPGRGKQYLRTHSAEYSPDAFCGVMYKVTLKSSHYQEVGSSTTFGQIMISLITEKDDIDVPYGPYEVFRKNETELHAGQERSGVTLALKPAVRFGSVDHVRARIEYIPRDGLLIDGEPRWSIDEIVVVDPFGIRMKYSSFETTLEASVPLDIVLTRQP